ncbi:MAG TPA: DUF1320 domain-containing protein [Candidatus Angelobacter sp.]|nr:DUF1320 domain-containing protein [Candidatus Angelobacter sp.]
MAYATQDDLSPRRITPSELVQLTDDTNSGQVNVKIVSDILDEASALIDSYCRQRYTIPLQSSNQVNGLTLTIAEWFLYQRRKRMKKDVSEAYEYALQFLRDVGVGKASLDQPVAAVPQSGSGDVRATQNAERFSDDNLAGYV